MGSRAAVGLLLTVALATTLGAGSFSPAPAAGTSASVAAASARQVVPASDAAGHEAPLTLGIAFGNQLIGLGQQQLSAALEDTVDVGADSIRIDIGWDFVQPHGPRSWRFHALDRVVRAADRHHLKVLGILTYTPPWARERGCGDHFSCPPAHDAQFARFAHRVARRYRNEMYGYEIWNEPNIKLFWRGVDAVAYRHLLVPTVKAIRSADRSTKIITGGLAPNDDTRSTSEAGRFLRTACAHGACRRVNGIGFHPYTYPHSPEEHTSPPSNWQRMTRSHGRVQSIEAVLRGLGIGQKKLWLTEYGAPSGGPGPAGDGTQAGYAASPDHVTEQWQAHIISEAIRLSASHRNVIDSLYVYDLDDPPHGPGVTKEFYFGMRRGNGTAKPSYAAFRAAAAATH